MLRDISRNIITLKVKLLSGNLFLITVVSGSLRKKQKHSSPFQTRTSQNNMLQKEATILNTISKAPSEYYTKWNKSEREK